MIPAVAAAAALSLLAGLPAADPPPAPGEVTIEKVSVIGTGCLPHTVATAISPDNHAFTVTYSEYIASMGPGVKNKEARKDCRITLRLNVPAGMTYAISHADYRGFSSLEPGVAGSVSAAYFFQGVHSPTVSTRTDSGPFDDNWQLSSDPATPAFGPCGRDRKLRIDTDLQVSGGPARPTAVSAIGMDSADADFVSTYRLAWKKC